MIKLIVCDVDGTLLDEAKHLDRKIISTIAGLHRKGIRFTVATGRNEAIVGSYIDQFGIDVPYATDNGANIWCRHQLLKSNSVEKAYTGQIIQTLIKAQIPFTFFDSSGGYSFGTSKKLQEIRKLFRSQLVMHRLSSTADYTNVVFYKLTLDSAGFPEMENLVQKVTALCPQIAFNRSEDTLYTITAEGTSKGQALSLIARQLNVQRHEVMSIGDNFNDLSMFRQSGIGVAMEHSDELIKQQADEIAPTHQAGGVNAYLIGKFLSSRIKE
ncbi:HAD family hydrolase [Holdemania massiliensis]|uniref:HAD family hydrolase n=1 Tax=Holdemania massiliensis TaxID=1468449 RepID=UPI000310F18B|nr:HAD family hydrolase [Holdemania massiliensis]